MSARSAGPRSGARAGSRILSSLLSLLWLGAAASSCSGSKEPTYFALASRVAPPPSAAAAQSTPRLVELRRPGIAGYLDRADIVMKVKDYQLHIDTSERWAEPLGDMVGRVLAQNLSSRLGESQVFVENGAISAIPDATVAVDVQTFDVGGDGQVTLVAQVVIETSMTSNNNNDGGGGASRASSASGNIARAKRFTLHAQPTTTSTAGLVAAMSTLLGDLADNIAAMLREH